MRPLAVCRIASRDVTIRQAMVTASRQGRRTGAIMLIDQAGCLAGLFTDSDLAKLLETRCDAALDQPIRDRMTCHPLTASPRWQVAQVIAVMSQKRISELPVIDDDHRPLGMLDITDLVAQHDFHESGSTASSSPATLS